MRSPRIQAARFQGHRVFTILLDQGLSTSSNAALVIAVSRNESVASFGEFATAYVVFAFVLGIQRAGVADPFLVSADGSGEFESVDHLLFLRNLIASAAFGTFVLAIASVAVGQVLGQFLLQLALVAWAVLVQDGLRYYAMALARPQVAVAMDGSWLVIFVAGLMAVPAVDGVGAIRIWGFAALSSLVVGIALLHSAIPRVVRTRVRGPWIRMSFGAEYAVIALSGLVLLSGLRVVLGPEATAAVFAVATVFQPAQSALAGLRFLYVPRLRARVNTDVYRSEVALWVLVVIATMIFWLAVCWVGQDLLSQLLGDTWVAARAILVAGAAFELCHGISMLLSDTLKLVDRGRVLVAGRLIFVGLALIAAHIGALAIDIQGAAVGRAIGASVGLAVWLVIVKTVPLRFDK